MLTGKVLHQGIAASVFLCMLLCLGRAVKAQELWLDEVIIVPDDTVFPPVPPPLNEKCIVAILNRVAQVRPDGTWTVQNVPSNFGMVRARATCVSNGITWGAESDLFTVPLNGVVAVGELQFDTLTPIPTALRVTAPTTTLTTTGATVQLSVIATLSDGSTRNATAANVGTNYTTSNPTVATVSPDGLITAVASGTVIVSVTHEGVLGLIRLQVAFSSGDTDRDGIPDDVETANGLNPNDPVDGFLDADGDGLTNKQELIDFGTNFQVTDSDGDTIADGEEVQAGADGFVTNPLLRDTDGDGSDDAAEIAAGSDPTNPASRPALVAMEVSPANFTLTVNTIIGEASQKLAVTGRRADGSTVNLTADPGTNYASSNLTVCNFGTEKGRVFASNNGTCTITVTNSNLSAQSSITVRTFAPTSLSFVSIPGFANNVDVSGDYAYVAAGATGLQVVDVSNPNAPTLVSSENTPGNANDVVVVGDLAYVADGSSGLQIIDISDPLDPIIIKAVDTPGVAQDVAVKDNLALVADGSAGLQIIDITDPAAAKLLSSIDTAGTAKGVAVSRDLPRAVIADGSGGIRVINLTDPTSPSIIGNVSTGGDARDVALSGNFAFVADFSRSFTVVDLSNPTAPVVRASTPSATGGLLTDVAQAGRFAFGADVFFVNGVPIIDVSVPATPIPRAILDFSAFRDDNGTGVAVDDTFVYLTAEQSTITENGTTGNTRLYIGQYLALEDAAGIAPTVNITSPASGETVIEGATLPITVAATDDVTVAAVNLLVNGILVSTDTTAPYQFTLTVPTRISSLTLGATAGDIGGNMGTAQDVMVNVIPDPLTTVIGRVLAQGGNLVAGATVTCADVSALTGADGTFSIPAVPTIAGAIQCTATFEAVTGISSAVPAVRGGITDVGQIQPVSCLMPPSGLVSWYPGDGHAEDIADSHPGTLRNGAGFAPGLVEQAFNVDGINDFVEVGFWTPGNRWTVEAWVRPSATPAGRRTIGGGMGQLRDWGIAQFNGQFGVVIRPPGGSTQTIFSGVSAVIGTWYHIVGTSDGTTAKIYVNGVLKNSGPVDPNYVGTAAGTQIGGEVCCSGNNFPGLIDEVSIYDRALSGAEIQALFEAGSRGKCK